MFPILLAFATFWANPSYAEDKSDKIRQRVEQLFVWKVSDRLQLTPDQESKFEAAFKKITEEKQKNSQELDTALVNLEKAKADKKQSAKLLKTYLDLIKKSNQLPNREMDTVSKIFGSEKMVEYVLLKREMTQKFKDALVQGRDSKAELKEPSVIQEK